MPAIYWICIFLNRCFHERSFIVISTDRSERRDLTGIATSPLSENADSDGTDEPMHMSVSRASSDNRGKRSWPMVAHHATASWHRSSPALVNWKKSSISLSISSLSCSGCDSGPRTRSRRAETRMVLVFLFDSDDSAVRVFATPWMSYCRQRMRRN